MDSEIDGILKVVVILAFLPVMATLILHSKPLARRLSLIIFVGMCVLSGFVTNGVVGGITFSLAILLSPILIGFFSWIISSFLKLKIEKEYGPTGIPISIIREIVGTYCIFLAID